MRASRLVVEAGSTLAQITTEDLGELHRAGSIDYGIARGSRERVLMF